ncbi:hypothetical protein NX871_32300 [Burkholderia thailandensis]|uniref:hypothetical protein n=1 Tax=Burkholderia thailandensis TaxID=57975 RepID=UPI00217DD89D|nr:hypothetical protein [Burkholderia thailandensis]MCS6474532.1 hypothetical protein [Burkholderia thailandensis]
MKEQKEKERRNEVEEMMEESVGEKGERKSGGTSGREEEGKGGEEEGEENEESGKDGWKKSD